MWAFWDRERSPGDESAKAVCRILMIAQRAIWQGYLILKKNLKKYLTKKVGVVILHIPQSGIAATGESVFMSTMKSSRKAVESEKRGNAFMIMCYMTMCCQNGRGGLRM
jgi:hypothetical protein